ncbi:MAG: alpha/beta hydrolase [Kineosporiaceae bacterium]
MEELRFAAEDGEVLEAVLDGPSDPSTVAVLAHPHPLRGGTFDSPLVVALQRRMADRGVASLRFNFRGTGRSTGEHGDGLAERADVLGAVACLRDRHPARDVHLVGYSFGGRVVLSVTGPAIASWTAVAAPLLHDPDVTARRSVGADGRRKLLLVPEHDQFCGPDEVRALTADWAGTDIEVVAGVDHYLGDAMASVAARVADSLATTERTAR